MIWLECCIPTLPLILEGAISPMKTGPTLIPTPAPMPTKTLHEGQQRPASLSVSALRHLPRSSGVIDAETVIKPAPTVTKTAFILIAPFRPYLSANMLPTRLPISPPRVNDAVTAENWASVMGMQDGSPWYDSTTPPVVRHVITACSWLRTEM